MGNSLENRSTTLAPGESARRLGVKVSTLANWRWSGRGPAYLKVGGKVRYRAEDLASWLDSQTRRSTSEAPRDAS